LWVFPPLTESSPTAPPFPVQADAPGGGLSEKGLFPREPPNQPDAQGAGALLWMRSRKSAAGALGGTYGQGFEL